MKNKNKKQKRTEQELFALPGQELLIEEDSKPQTGEPVDKENITLSEEPSQKQDEPKDEESDAPNQEDNSQADSSQLEALKQELRREQYKRRFRRVLRSTVSALIVVAAIAALIATLVLPVLEISGTSMEPSLYAGDMVALVKNTDMECGDLCAFYYSNKVLIKRVIAVPGDYLWIESDGTVVLNGETLDEPYVTQKALGECDVEFPYQVPENHYFVMGDQRETSIDSRSSTIGSIAEDQIIGKLLFRFWPLTSFSWF